MSGQADILGTVEAAYRQHFEVIPARASVSFVGVDPIEILRYDQIGSVDSGDKDPVSVGVNQDLLTLGMSKYPMAGADESVVDAATAPRAELILTVHVGSSHAWRTLAVLAAAPAVEGAVHAVGNRIDLNEPFVPGSRCTGAVIAEGPLLPIAVPGIADVHLLRVIPATATELAWARVHGTESLRQRWAEEGTDLADLGRDAVTLT